MEYVVVLGNQRSGTREVAVPTSQPAGAGLRLVSSLGDDAPEPGSRLQAGAAGVVKVRVPALGVVVWQAEAALNETRGAQRGSVFAAPSGTATLVASLARDLDGQVLSGAEIRVAVTWGRRPRGGHLPRLAQLPSRLLGVPGYGRRATLPGFLASPGRSDGGRESHLCRHRRQPPRRPRLRPAAVGPGGTFPCAVRRGRGHRAGVHPTQDQSGDGGDRS